MTTKTATTIAATIELGLTGNALNEAIHAALKTYANDPLLVVRENEVNEIINAYRQRDSIAELAGDAKKPVAKKTATKKPVAKKTATKKPVAKKTATKKVGVGALQIKLIVAGKDNAAVLKEVKKAFPESATTVNCVAWYRSKIRLGKFGADNKKAFAAIEKAAK